MARVRTVSLTPEQDDFLTKKKISITGLTQKAIEEEMQKEQEKKENRYEMDCRIQSKKNKEKNGV
jgi:hypothetical protein